MCVVLTAKEKHSKCSVHCFLHLFVVYYMVAYVHYYHLHTLQLYCITIQEMCIIVSDIQRTIVLCFFHFHTVAANVSAQSKADIF